MFDLNHNSKMNIIRKMRFGYGLLFTSWFFSKVSRAINFFPFGFWVKGFFKNMFNYYICISKKLDDITWSDAHLYKLVHRKYKPNKKLNKMAFIIPNNVVLDHFKNIFPYLDKGSFDIIAVASLGYNICERLKEYALQNYYSYFLLNDIFKKRYIYKLAIYWNPNYTGTIYVKGKPFNGMQLFAEKYLHAQFKSTIEDWWLKKNQVGLADYIICVGDYFKHRYEKLGIKAKIYPLGSPRFEKYDLTQEAANKTYVITKYNLNIDPLKKTILWVPGHTNVDSLQSFGPIINRLNDDFNIIIKPHPHRYKEIANYGEIITSLLPDAFVLNDIDTIELFPLADFIFCDYGGSVLTAIKADKNVLLLNAENTDDVKRYIGLESPEILIRDKIINFSKNQEKDIITALYNTEIWERQKEIRKEIREYFFTENANVTEDIADFLLKVINDEI
jgi:hypothetical protein